LTSTGSVLYAELLGVLGMNMGGQLTDQLVGEMKQQWRGSVVVAAT
jgi:hypothetical protein